MYKKNCKGCMVSQGLEPVLGNIFVELGGGWILNHYGDRSDKGFFLGRMVLQPKFHRMDLSELIASEAAALGDNIVQVSLALRHCWSIRFPKDHVERMYVVYFFESAFDDPPTEWHMHIHLIPRTERMGKGESGCGKPSNVAAWNMKDLASQSWFPEEYKIRERDEEVAELMACLKLHLDRHQPNCR